MGLDRAEANGVNSSLANAPLWKNAGDSNVPSGGTERTDPQRLRNLHRADVLVLAWTVVIMCSSLYPMPARAADAGH